MNKTLIYIIILLALGVASWFFVFQEDNRTVDMDETHFHIEDTSKVYKIFMADMGSQEILLERTLSGWRLNGEERARPDGIDLILGTMNRIRVDYPVPSAGRDNIIKLLASDATKVEAYDKDDEFLISYYVGGSTNDIKGTYMILNGAKDPYVVHIPGFDGDVSTRYFLDKEVWKDRGVFRYQLERIKQITIDYPGYPEHGFTLTLTKDSFSLDPTSDGLQLPSETVKRDYLARYLSFFKNVNAEGYENSYPLKDSVLASTPFCVIKITDRLDTENEVKIFLKPVTSRTKVQFDEKGDPMLFDEDRYFALVNHGRDFAMIQQFNFGKLFMRYKDFFLEAES
ncbi:MAG: hypothetical protein IH946_00225 [Bacteroidetes bacterium]|nr:hypothetical protein [Bacteroidota bacterium]